MPWDKRVEGDKICVYKKTTGKTMHCYPNTSAGEEEANKYLAALHIHASEKELMEILGGVGSELLAYKEDDGRYKIITVSTAALKDREEETFDAEAIDYDAAAAEKHNDYPEYRLFHKEGLAIGKVESMRRVGIFAVDEGHSYADPFSISTCEKMLANNDGTWRCSRGFYVIEASGGCPKCHTNLLIKKQHMQIGFKCPSCNSVYTERKGVLKDLHFRKVRTFDITITDNPAVPWTGVTAYRELQFSEDNMTKKELRQKLLDAGLPEDVIDAKLKSLTDAQLKEYNDIPFAKVLKELDIEEPEGDEEVVYEVDDEFMTELSKTITDTVRTVVKEVLDGFEIKVTDVGDLEVDMKEVPEIVAIKEAVADVQASVKELNEKLGTLLEKDDKRLKEMLDEIPRAGKLRIRRFKGPHPEDEDDDSEEDDDGDFDEALKEKRNGKHKAEDDIEIVGADGRVATSMTEFITGE